MSFTLATTDGAYTFTTTTPATVQQSPVNNNKLSNTQGFLIKQQVGRVRVEMSCTLNATKTNVETNLLPQITYPQSVNVTIDRNILGKTTNTMTGVIASYDISDEFDEGNEYLVTLKIIEVLTT